MIQDLPVTMYILRQLLWDLCEYQAEFGHTCIAKITEGNCVLLWCRFFLNAN